MIAILVLGINVNLFFFFDFSFNYSSWIYRVIYDDEMIFLYWSFYY